MKTRCLLKSRNIWTFRWVMVCDAPAFPSSPAAGEDRSPCPSGMCQPLFWLLRCSEGCLRETSCHLPQCLHLKTGLWVLA